MEYKNAYGWNALLRRGTEGVIKFPVGMLNHLRSSLLQDLSREQFALLLARREPDGGAALCCVTDMRLFGAADLEGQGVASLRIRKDRVLDVLMEVQRRVDADMILDVHTHPFSETAAIFSSIDDQDLDLQQGRNLPYCR